MNDPDRAPSPKRFCRRFGIRNAALNASAARERWPKYCEKIAVRASPASRLARIPAATIASAAATRLRAGGWLTATRRRLRARDRAVGVRRLPGEPRQHDRVLLEILLAHALVRVHVGVVHAHVVVLVFLNRVEARHAHRAETQVISVADAGKDILPDAELGLRLE